MATLRFEAIFTHCCASSRPRQRQLLATATPTARHRAWGPEKTQELPICRRSLRSYVAFAWCIHDKPSWYSHFFCGLRYRTSNPITLILDTPQMIPIMWTFPIKPWFLRGWRNIRGMGLPTSVNVYQRRYPQPPAITLVAMGAAGGLKCLSVKKAFTHSCSAQPPEECAVLGVLEEFQDLGGWRFPSVPIFPYVHTYVYIYISFHIYIFPYILVYI